MKKLIQGIWAAEPAAIIAAVLAIVNAVQVAAVSMPTWAHTVIAVVSIALGGLVTRSQVVPLAKARFKTGGAVPRPGAPTSRPKR